MSIKIRCSRCGKQEAIVVMNQFAPQAPLCDQCKRTEEGSTLYKPKLQGRNLSVEELKDKDAKEKAEIARTGLLFDPKEFGTMFSHGPIMHYFNKINKASTIELKIFRVKIRQYKGCLKGKAFANCDISLYGILKAAIDHELLKRNRLCFAAYTFFIPLRQQLSWWAGHRTAQYHKEYGILFVYKESYDFFYAPISKHLKALQRFWLLHWKWILNTSGGVGLAVLLYELVQKRPH